ncbi:MAG: CRISPR-associated protein Csx3 [Anaerolineae bacterium]
MELFPAVAIGGPPHSGKSVLAYSLSKALRARQIAHYVLRAFPDGEGDWANEADQALVRRIRIKGSVTPEWIQHICRDVARRHLPLIVDMGGQPTDWQEAVLDHCTHIILLTRDRASHAHWTRLARRHNLPVIADLHSVRSGEDVLHAHSPVLRGHISGLERGRTASGVVFTALVDLVASLFAYDQGELRRIRIANAPADLVVELERLRRMLATAMDRPWEQWSPEQLGKVLVYAPPHLPLAIYDRGPNWLYAALAVHVYPALLYQFDVRLGWIAPPTLELAEDITTSPVRADITLQDPYAWVELSLPGDYLDYGEIEQVRLPRIPADKGVILSGKLPLWLWTAAARAYRIAPWLGVYQPQLGMQAVVVMTRVRNLRPGMLLPCELPARMDALRSP